MGHGGMQIEAGAHGNVACWAASDKGTVRDHNEDSFVIRPKIGLFAVADGAGGHQHGQVASNLVVELLGAIADDASPSDVLKETRARLRDAHDVLREKAAALHANAIIATTVVVLLLAGRHYACLWVGDSRIYLLRDGVLVRVTRDHSLVQELIDAGALSEDQAENHPRANVITRAIGASDDELEIDMVTDRLFPGDRFLLCSDGVTKSTQEEELSRLLTADDDRPAERVLQAALGHKATDNITAVAVRILHED